MEVKCLLGVWGCVKLAFFILHLSVRIVDGHFGLHADVESCVVIFEVPVLALGGVLPKYRLLDA